MCKINKNSNKTFKQSKTAFSLIEMSVVLLIIAIVVSGMLTISTVAVTNERVRVTKERIDIIYKALGRYMLKNYKLPCPASLLASKNSFSSYGIATSGNNGNCSGVGIYTSITSPTLYYGAVPVNTLGLADEYAEDGFGNKFDYVMYGKYNIQEFNATINNNGFSFSGADSSRPSLISMPSNASNNDNAFVLISHGANRYGAFPAGSATQISTVGASAYEISNCLTNITLSSIATFGVVPSISGINFVTSDSDSVVFDDIIFGKTRSAMILDFNAMFLMPCVGDSSYSSAYYGRTVYNNASCPAPNSSIFSSKKCTNFGAWIAVQNCP